MNTVNQPAGSSRPAKRILQLETGLLFAAPLLLAWLALLIFVSRHEMLDDALIHLRYAAMLAQHHFLTYDGVHPTYGASSVLYVLLLALLRFVTTSSMLPKLVSLAAYVILLVLLAGLLWRWRHRPVPAALLFFLLLTVCGPMGVRWLTDGMETSLVAVVAVLLAMCAHRAASRVRSSASASMVLLLLSAATVVLRVDLSLLVGVASGAIFVAGLQSGERAGAAVKAALPAALGGALGATVLVLTMGHLLPDTALAKAGVPPLAVAFTMVHVLASAYSLGIGACAVWLATLGAAFARRIATGGPVWALLVANSAFPLLYAGAMLHGQQLQGVRYVLWALLFSIIWNVMEAATCESVRPMHTSGWLQLAGAAALLFFLVSFAIETPAFLRIERGRSATYLAMRRQPLSLLAGQTGIAADVGFIGYFSQANICDLSGLVNGRTAARMSPEMRVRRCVQEQPSFAFVSAPQQSFLANYMHLDDWESCEAVDFTNVGSSDRHLLLLRRGATGLNCAVLLGHQQ
ncbi:MAG: hypothetical protein ACR2JE_09710 [Acidobacteriaceae bacterium]